MPSLADPDKTLAVGDLLGNRVTAGVTVHRNFGRELGRSKALLWHALFMALADPGGIDASRPPPLLARGYGVDDESPLDSSVAGKASPSNEFLQQLLKRAACSVHGCASYLGIR
jgi:hypothetical protein